MATQEVSLDTDKLFIRGGWVQSTGSGRIDVISPSTEEHVGSVPDGTEGDGHRHAMGRLLAARLKRRGETIDRREDRLQLARDRDRHPVLSSRAITPG